MNYKKTSLLSAIAIASAIFALTLPMSAQVVDTFRVLHSFTGKWDGSRPYGPVLFDPAGSIYGTTQVGGNMANCAAESGCGLVYKLSSSSGSWIENPIFGFASSATGAIPHGNLVMDASGDIFGVALAGGGATNCTQVVEGCGLVYELTPTSSGPWNETVLQTFNNGSEGGNPEDGLVADGAGNFYGTASSGGSTNHCGGSGCGVVYKLSPTSTGGWEQQILYAFTGGADGGIPTSKLIFDASGNLYGTAYLGGDLVPCGPEGCGVVFELSPSSSGTWIETVLHAFAGNQHGDGYVPFGALAFDAAGNLYGTTYNGGTPSTCNLVGCGVIYKLTPTASGWKETLIHDFQGGSDGANPPFGVTLDAAGNVYGVTSAGGFLTDCSGLGCGVVFKFSTDARGQWQETLLHQFTGGNDGASPSASLTFGPDGKLYGVTVLGGTSNAGIVFNVAP